MTSRRARRWWFPGGLLAATLASHGIAPDAHADSPASDDETWLADDSTSGDTAIVDGPTFGNATPLADSSGSGATAGNADSPVFGNATTLADDQLDQLRGGFTLPNGMDIAIGIDIQTTVNGALALRTMMTNLGTGVPVLFVGEGGASASAGGASASAGPEGAVATVPGGGVVRLVTRKKK